MAHRLRPLIAASLGVFAVGCGDGWEPSGEQRRVEPVFFAQDYACQDGTASVELPAGLPIVLEVYGEADADDGSTTWWVYEDPPEFREGETVRIPCQEGQDGGRVVYVHE